MSCADDPASLAAETMAIRGAQLAQAAEAGARSAGHPSPLYIVGTEVPVPGGAAEHLDTLAVTAPTDAAETLALHARAFAMQGVGAAFTRVVALVVQPGVEFGQENVIPFAPKVPPRWHRRAKAGAGSCSRRIRPTTSQRWRFPRSFKAALPS